MNTTRKHLRGAERDVQRRLRLIEPTPQEEPPQREAPQQEVPPQSDESQAWYVPEIRARGEGTEDDPFTTLRPVHPPRPHDAAEE